MRIAVYTFLGLCCFSALANIARPPAHPREVINYVDEHGNPVPASIAEAYLSERERLLAIERESLAAYHAERQTAARQEHEERVWYPPSRPTREESPSATGARREAVYVSGHYRKNGTYVAPHYRSAPNRTQRDNWSTRGNTNPRTGQLGSRSARR